MKERSRRVVAENSGLVHQVGIAAGSRSCAKCSGTDCQRSGGSGFLAPGKFPLKGKGNTGVGCYAGVITFPFQRWWLSDSLRYA